MRECLARPILVDRLARNFFSYDSGIHAEARWQAQDLRDALISGRLDPRSDLAGRTVTTIALERTRRAGPSAGPPSAPGNGQDPSRLELAPGEFARYRARLPRGVGDVGPVAEERERFVVRVVLESSDETVRVASFVVRKAEWEEWWRSVSNRLDERSVQAAGESQDPLPAPQVKEPETLTASTCLDDERWDNGSLDDLPDPRDSHTAVWTGSQMIVWGGSSSFNSGGRYDPATDSWMPTSTTNAPSARSGHSAVWTGSLMVVWGGYAGSYFNSGGRYDPVTDTWTPTSTTNAPSARSSHSAVWTGSRMVVWGGNNGTHFNTGGRYDPATDNWTPTSTTNAPSARSRHTAVWTGSRMVVWGGSDDASYFRSGAR